MKDSYGRVIDYMRISITDRCNLRCRYCMPDGIKSIPVEQILTLEEIAEVCRIASELGITKFKVTGGEPLVRKGCTELIRMLKALPHTEQVTLTTNGILLAAYAKELKEVGIDGVNVSLDTLCAEKFAEITGYDRLKDVLEGIRTAHALGLKVKINTVLQKGVNEGEWEALLQIAKETPIDIRFIEMMPIGHEGICFQSGVVGKDPWKIWRNDRRSKEAAEQWARSIFWAWQWTGSVLPDTGISGKCWIY